MAIESRFTKGLETNTPPNAKKTGRLKSIGSGVVIAGFLMLAFLLGRKLLRNLKPRTHS
jgi:hypothetical protein